MPEFKKYPYRSEFPDSAERWRNHQTLEDALQWARWTIHARWHETNEYGSEGEYVHDDAAVALVTNRATGYRWILRRRDHRVEFQTPQMLEDAVGEQGIDLHLSVEEAEALARAAKSERINERRTKALVDQALDQVALLCRQVRERVRVGDAFIDAWTRGIPRTEEPSVEVSSASETPPPARKTQRARALGDPDNLTLKEAAQILGKARNTVYLWFKNGKFPPAVDVGSHVPYNSKPVIVVPRYRLEAWQQGRRMPSVLQDVFETRGLHEAPWVCFMPRKGASREDLEFWVERRNLAKSFSKDGRRIYGEGVNEAQAYEVVELR